MQNKQNKLDLRSRSKKHRKDEVLRNEKKGITHGLHTSRFNIDENALKIGMGLLSYLAINQLNND